MSVTVTSFIIRPRSLTKVVADHRFVISADTSYFDQLSTLGENNGLMLKNIAFKLPSVVSLSSRTNFWLSFITGQRTVE